MRSVPRSLHYHPLSLLYPPIFTILLGPFGSKLARARLVPIEPKLPSLRVPSLLLSDSVQESFDQGVLLFLLQESALVMRKSPACHFDAVRKNLNLYVGTCLCPKGLYLDPTLTFLGRLLGLVVFSSSTATLGHRLGVPFFAASDGFYDRGSSTQRGSKRNPQGSLTAASLPAILGNVLKTPRRTWLSCRLGH
ncbi:hypothetical protein NLU13_8856 [Sarocladium strictum]|uniref:Uncharacterized protein n=1 Tax=Sarocladium strictum TaxID=5046 RepID=A0AA39L3T9_SARSR|nr:hypothetical protein NLU13_8856 [Sarocladium strictum]